MKGIRTSGVQVVLALEKWHWTAFLAFLLDTQL